MGGELRVRLHWGYELVNPKGKVISKRKFKVNSWNPNILLLFFNMFYAWSERWSYVSPCYEYIVPYGMIGKDPGWVLFRLSSRDTDLRYGLRAPEDVEIAGIVIGSDNTVFENYVPYWLLSQIPTTTLKYGDTNVSFSGETVTVKRKFTNITNNNVSVGEVGLAFAGESGSGAQNSALLARDVTSTLITVPPQVTIYITYTITFTW